jgi:5-methylcytosine-specific restriction endonuclease McrA
VTLIDHIDLARHEESPPAEISKSGKKRIRKALFEQQCGLCAYCGAEMSIKGFNSNLIASFDHIIPLAHGGPDAPENIVLACWSCNRLKANMTPIQLRRLADRIEELTHISNEGTPAAQQAAGD